MERDYGQEIDTVTVLPVDGVRKEDRKRGGERKGEMDGETEGDTGERGGSEHFSLWGQAGGRHQLNKLHTGKLKYSHSRPGTYTLPLAHRQTHPVVSQ